MKFKSQVYTAVSGSVGGVTYSHNAGGMYARARAIPVNSNTEFQQTVRSIMANLSSLWADEDGGVDRTGWDLYASHVPLRDALGDLREISGLAHFIRSNVPRMQAGYAVKKTAPTDYSLATGTLPHFTFDDDTQKLNVTFTNGDAWAGEVGGALMIWASRPQSPGIKYFRGPYRYAGKVAGAVTPPTSPAAIDYPFPIVEGHQCFVKVRFCRSDGRLGSPLRFWGTVG